MWVPSQASALHGLPSSVQAVPAGLATSDGHAGAIPLQLSATSHSSAAGRQTVPAWPAGCTHVPSPSHWSSVHTLPSSAHAVPVRAKQLSAVSSQVRAHSGPPVHGSPACTLHVPLLHVSAPLQKRPSLHGAVLLGWTQVPVPLHWSSVHTLPSSVQPVPVGAKVLAGQVVLVPVQTSARSHSPAAGRHTVPALPAGCWQVTAVPSQRSAVHGLPSSVHAVSAGWRASAGQAGAVPEQVSATSHSPALCRHTVP